MRTRADGMVNQLRIGRGQSGRLGKLMSRLNLKFRRRLSPRAKSEAKTETKAELQPDTKATEVKPETKVKTPSGVTPQLVEGVHELYEELPPGRPIC
jgi:hypothetical protein